MTGTTKDVNTLEFMFPLFLSIVLTKNVGKSMIKIAVMSGKSRI